MYELLDLLSIGHLKGNRKYSRKLGGGHMIGTLEWQAKGFGIYYPIKVLSRGVIHIHACTYAHTHENNDFDNSVEVL